MKSKIKTKEYFDDYLKVQENSISEFLTVLKLEGQLLTDESKGVLYYSLFGFSLNAFFVKNYYELSLQELNFHFCQVLNYCELSWRKSEDLKDVNPYYSYDEYWNILTMLSIGYLLNIEDKDFLRIVKMRDAVKMEDKLLDYIINAKTGNRQYLEIMRTNQYHGLIEVINEDDKQVASTKLVDYVKKQWYADNKKVYWYNSHNSSFDTFFGYWCFAAGAIAKIKGLNDEELKDSEYYPYDMVHLKE